MELTKLSAKDIRAYDKAQLRETEHLVRRELLNVRMDIYTAKSTHGAKVQRLRKTLARLLTVKNQTKTAK